MPDSALSSDLAARILANQVTALLLLDRDYRLRFMNVAAEMLFSASNATMTGQPIGQLLRCTSGALEERAQTALENHQPVTERQVVLEMVDGHRITVDCTLVPMVEESPPMLLMELRQVDRQLRLSREEQLIRQNETARTLVRGLAHEIKNPLGGIRGAAQLLEMDGGDATKEYTSIILKEVDRLGALVDGMLGTRKAPVKQKVNIHQVLERVAGLVESDPDSEVKLVRDYDPSIPDLEGDPDQLVQALLNLVRNAVQASQPGQEVLLQTRVLRQFTLAGRRHRLVIQINVLDHGAGIPAELQHSIFFPMVTNKAEGTGLGLPIAQSLVHRHGGLIEFESRPGRTLFTVYLPLESGS